MTTPANVGPFFATEHNGAKVWMLSRYADRFPLEELRAVLLPGPAPPYEPSDAERVALTEAVVGVGPFSWTPGRVEMVLRALARARGEMP